MKFSTKFSVKSPAGLTAVSALSALILAGCGGGNDSANDERGFLREQPRTIATLTAAQIDASTASSGLQPLTGKAKCDVDVVAMEYATVGPKQEKANASGVMLVPAGTCASSSMPLVAYARGTEVLKTRTLANPSDGETFLLTAMYASQGYAVVATDYLGYAKSTFPYHPYLHADSEATSVIDSIRAARKIASTRGTNLSGKVMLTGYSQGGHSAFAAQRAIEQSYASEIKLAASAPLAGPYNLSGSFKLPQAIAGYQFFVPLIVTSFQKVYGNVYSDPSQVYNAPYAATIESLLPSPTLTYTTLLTTGALPAGTPDQARAALFKQSFITDVSTNPNNTFFQDAQKNDLLDWTPRTRTLLCGGAGDPTVPPAVHRDVAQAIFTSKGLTNVTSVDVDPQVRATFGTGGQAPTDPTSAAFATYYGNYHGTYEPPFCHAAARALFDQFK